MQSDCSDHNLNLFIKNLGFNKFDSKLVEIAFTHASYTKEKDKPYTECYERLEFLGDAVLKMAITDYLYKKFPNAHEGELTKIRSVVVSDEILHKIAQKIDIERYIKVSSAEEKCGGKKLQSIQACVMEALFGALYISSDREALNTFIINELSEYIEDMSNKKTIYNSKALLQEYTQSKSKELPIYETVGEYGEPHNRVFEIQVSYEGKVLAKSKAKTKKQAQQKAAYIACMNIGLIKKDTKINE